MKRSLKKKQNEQVHDTQGFIAAELADVKDRLHAIRYCTTKAKQQSRQTKMSNNSS